MNTFYRLLDIGVSPVISCIFTRLFYMIISRWNQFTHMFIDFFFFFYQPIDWCRNNLTPSCLEGLHYLICCVLTTWQLKCHFVFLLLFPPYDCWTDNNTRCLFLGTQTGLIVCRHWLLPIGMWQIHQLRMTFRSKLNKKNILMPALITQFIFTNILVKWLPSGYWCHIICDTWCIPECHIPVGCDGLIDDNCLCNTGTGISVI